MKKHKLVNIILVFNLITHSLFGQWSHSTTTNGFDNLRDIHFVNANYGFAVGLAGSFHHTNNGGISWLQKFAQYPGVQNSSNSRAVFAVDTNEVFIVGGGTFVKSSDLFVTFTQPIPLLNYYTRSIYFTSPDTGFVATNARIYRTFDGGESFDDVFIFISDTTVLGCIMNDVEFVNKEVGYVVGECGAILKTTDKGNNWSILRNEVEDVYYDQYFMNADTGFVVGTHNFGTNDIIAILLKTTNGGANWDTTLFSQSWSFYGIDFYNENEGFIVGKDGILLKTIDGGLSWNEVTSPSTEDLVAIDCPDVTVCYAASYTDIYKYDVESVNIKELSVSKLTTQLIPNPIIQGGELFIGLANESSIKKLEIIDLSGRVIYSSTNLENGKYIDTSHLKKGIYLVAFSSESNRIKTEKLIIQ